MAFLKHGTNFLFPWLLSMSLLTSYNTLQTPTRGVQPQTRGFPPPTPFHELYRWKQVDFTYPNQATRQNAIVTGAFIPENNLPLGLDVWQGRIFMTLPRWKTGVPATVVTIPRDYKDAGGNRSPLLQPYPNWSWHGQDNCDTLTSVFRLKVDSCGRLWILDSGVVDITSSATPACPPQIFVFDLRTDTLIWRYRFPADQVKADSLHTNIIVDLRNGQCDDAYAYVADVFRYGLVVYSWRQNKSWRVTHNLFYPDPLASKYELHGVTFRWTDGIFGLALSPEDPYNQDRTLFFHPMSSYREFAVPTSVLRNETGADNNMEAFVALGESRGVKNFHSSASGMDRRGVLFYNLVTRDSVGCWNSRQPAGYKRRLQGVVLQDNVTSVFPNDLKIDQEHRQSIWILSNKLHDYLYRSLDPKDYNFRILNAFTDDATRGTVCDPNYMYIPSRGDEAIDARSACPY